jgi:tRNA (guanine37-N1)-methyltransferase
LKKKVIEVHFHNLKDYASNKRKQVDDYQFGGGSGMVMMIEPINKCIDLLKTKRSYKEIIYMTPDGNMLTQKIANKLSIEGNLIVLCGHYKGVDQRVRDELITMEISIGDYVLSGGELPAAVLCDSIIRLIPGVLGDETSALSDSFQDDMLAPPVYTRPANFENLEVPKILLSGNKAKIEEWREEKALERTKKMRPDIFN